MAECERRDGPGAELRILRRPARGGPDLWRSLWPCNHPETFRRAGLAKGAIDRDSGSGDFTLRGRQYTAAAVRASGLDLVQVSQRLEDPDIFFV